MSSSFFFIYIFFYADDTVDVASLKKKIKKAQVSEQINPFQTNGFVHKATYNKVRRVHCIY